MQSPNRNVIVNEDDNRKLEIYTQGDLDASPTGIAVFASDAGGTLRILKQDNAGNLNVNIQGGNLAPFISSVSSTLSLTNADTPYLLPASELAGRKTVVFYNGSDTDIFIGDSAVNTQSGILLASGANMGFDSSAGIYGVCGGTGRIIRILELK